MKNNSMQQEENNNTVTEGGISPESAAIGNSLTAKKIIPANIVSRILIYALGLLALAFGVAFSINSNLGVSPINSLPYVISLITQMPLSRCVIGVFVCYIAVQVIIQRKEFPVINLTQILFSTLFGYFTDLAKWVLGSFTIPTYFGQLTMLAISIFLVALGVALYMGANLVNMPMEGMTKAIAECVAKKPFHQVKIVIDCVVVIVGVGLSFLFLGSLQGIREGTVLCALLVGKLLPYVKKVVDPLVVKFCRFETT